MEDENTRLKKMFEFGIELGEIHDLDMMLDRVLEVAREITNADAGSIYVVEDGKLVFSQAQNDTLSSKLGKGRKLIYTTFSIPINSSSIAGHVALTGDILNIEDVYRCGGDVPYSFDCSYDETARYRTKSMLTVPLRTLRGRIIGVLQMINARDEDGKHVPFGKELEPFVIYFANLAASAIERAHLTRLTILRMIRMAEARDPKETGAHANRVGAYSVEIYKAWAKKNGVPQSEIDSKRDILRTAAMLHDVGKIGISDTILKKPGRFTPEEFETMKTHTLLGARLFKGGNSEVDEMSFEIALNHHERWDGNGYPGHVDIENGSTLPGFSGENGKTTGKRGAEIPLTGRIVSVADVFDALLSRRVYKDAWKEDDVVKEITAQSGRQFDPEVVDAFLGQMDVMHAISARYPDVA